MNQLKEKIVEILNKSEPIYTKEGMDSFVNQLLSLFSQSLDEKIKEIEGLRIKDRRLKEVPNCIITYRTAFNEALNQVLSILKEKK